MSAELPDHEFGAARAPGKTDARPPIHLARERAIAFTRRWAVRNTWYRHPVVRLRHIVEDDALIVDILPLEPADDRLVDDLLCIEFDGTDNEAFPTSLCLTGFTAHTPPRRWRRGTCSARRCAGPPRRWCAPGRPNGRCRSASRSATHGCARGDG